MSLFLAGALLLGLLPVVAAARPALPAASIEAELLKVLAAAGTANFIVKMAVEADLSAAHGLEWKARGAYVYQALTWVARTSQAPALDYCRGHALDCRSLLAGNSVYVRGGSLSAAQGLAALPGVAYVRLERVYPLPAETLLPEGSVSWGLLDSHATDVWALGFRGAGAKVANIDTGVQWDHPALAGQYGCPLNPGDPKCWYDPANICGRQPCDDNGHGTHTMGTMVADDNPNFPYTAGMAPDATWIACKGCESSGCSEFALDACGDWALAPGGDPDNRPHVINNSWGGGGGDPWYRPVVIAWVAAGMVGGFASGGSGPSCATLGSPCDYPESFCTTGHDQSRAHASFASTGPGVFGHDPYTKPNISAPGVNIPSTVPINAWATWSGTSMASPHSMGAMALVISACPNLAWDVDALFGILQDNADPPPPGYCDAPPDGEGNYTYGYGYLNALAAVEACLPAGSLHLNKMKMNWAPGRPGIYKVIAAVRIHDQSHAVVPGATVLGDWTLPDGAVTGQQATTNSLGQAKFQQKSAQCGLFQLCVTGMSKPGYGYDPGANEAPACKSTQVGCTGNAAGP